MCSALGVHGMSDGGQQELGAGQAAQPQLEQEEEVREGECST